MLIQLLLQRFLQIHPPALILLVVIPEAEVSDLERGRVTEGSRVRQKTLPALVRDHFILFMGLGGGQRVRRLDGTINPMDMDSSQLPETVEDRGAWRAAGPWGHKELDTTQ